jgi:hypothetical protein
VRKRIGNEKCVSGSHEACSDLGFRRGGYRRTGRRGRDDPARSSGSANEPRAEGPRASFGIDPTEGNCPKAEPEKLPPDALAGATEAALDQVPSVFGDVEATEAAYAVAAYLGKSGLGRSPMIRIGLGCSQLLQDRSVTMDLVFPELEPSASLSQHTCSSRVSGAAIEFGESGAETLKVPGLRPKTALANPQRSSPTARGRYSSRSVAMRLSAGQPASSSQSSTARPWTHAQARAAS